MRTDKQILSLQSAFLNSGANRVFILIDLS